MQQISALKAFLVSVPEWRGLRLVLLPAVRGRHRKPAAAAYTDWKGAGFTIIELLVVVAIIAILAGLTLSTLGYVNRKGAESRARTEVAALAAAIESYRLECGAYPAADNLYTELTAAGPLNTNKVYFEPPPGMVNTNSNPRVFVDPYGSTYNYEPDNPTRNIGSFDLYCVPPAAESEKDWIHN